LTSEIIMPPMRSIVLKPYWAMSLTAGSSLLTKVAVLPSALAVAFEPAASK
jgi:hypothetical protein